MVAFILIVSEILTFYASTAYAEALCFCLVQCPSRLLSRLPSVSNNLFRFKRILNGFRRNSRDIIITTTNRYNDYVLGEIGIGTREQDSSENSNRRQTVLLDQTGADA